MSQLLRANGRLLASSLIINSILLAACQAAATPTAPASVAGVPSPAGSAAGSAPPETAVPTPLQLMPIGLLPDASFDPSAVDVVCEDVADAALSCEDAVALAAQMAITAAGANPVEQVLVERDAADPNVVQITFWAFDTDAEALVGFTSTVDIAAQTITFPVESEEASFPPS